MGEGQRDKRMAAGGGLNGTRYSPKDDGMVVLMGDGPRAGRKCYAMYRGREALHAYALDMKCQCPKNEDDPDRYRYQGVGDEDCHKCGICLDCKDCNKVWDKADNYYSEIERNRSGSQ